MRTNAIPPARARTLNLAAKNGDTIELVAVITAIVLAACGAASLVLTTPSALDAVANAAPAPNQPPPAERTFHERYRISPTAESIDAPTF
jgi:hypothetical protein